MDILGTDISKFPAWAQALATISMVVGGVLIKLFWDLKGSSHNSAPESVVTRGDFVEVFVREQQINRELLNRICVSNESIQQMMATDAANARALVAADIVYRRREREASRLNDEEPR